MKKIRFVIGTRKNRNAFFTNTAAGNSIPLSNDPMVELVLFPENTAGLSKIYNIAIEESINDPAILIFMHDDVHMLDFFWADQILNSLNKFDIVGLAGNKRRAPNQPAWAFIDEKFTWDKLENLSGVVGHGKCFPPSKLNVYGPPGQEVKLLDGMLLATYSETLIKNNIRFDERFDFHFYDLDFCRQAELANLKMGTWPLSVVHESIGDFGSEGWINGYQAYIDKWKE